MLFIFFRQCLILINIIKKLNNKNPNIKKIFKIPSKKINVRNKYTKDSKKVFL
jgi:hypothetical protein